MAAELMHEDPYTLVARHLQEGEANRAKLKSLTGLEYAQIEAALERFEIMETVAKREDGMGIDHYTWQGGEYKPDPPRPHAVEAQEASVSESAKDGIADDDEAGPSKGNRPIGWSLATKIREFLRGIDNDEQFSINEIYDYLTERYPNACETYEAGSLRAQLTPTLNSFVGREVVLVSRGVGKYPHLYQKKVETSIDPARVEALVAADLSTTEMCAELGVSVATWTRHRKADPKLQAAYEKGIKRRNAIEAYEQKNSTDSPKASARNPNGQKPLSKPSQDAVSKRTTDETETAQPAKERNIIPANIQIRSVDKIAPKEPIALHDSPVKRNDPATYALPAFITDLRAERDELDQLITLLERRVMRGG